MTAPLAGPPSTQIASPTKKLRAAAQNMEALFYGQLLQSMRDALPKDGAVAQSAGEQMFTSMLDDKIAGLAAAHSQHGLADAMYRQLVAQLPQGAAAGQPAAPATTQAPGANPNVRP